MTRTRPLQQVGQAGEAVEQAAWQVNALIRELRDGFTIYVQNHSDDSVLDFIQGKVKELPISLRVEPKERT